MDRKYLLQRRRGWYVRVRVPDSLFPVLGKRHIVRTLKTTDIETARSRRWAALAAIKKQLQDLAKVHAQDAAEPLTVASAIRAETELGGMTGDSADAAWDAYLSDYLQKHHPEIDPETGQHEAPEKVAAMLRLASSVVSGTAPLRASEALKSHLKEGADRMRPSTIKARDKHVSEFLHWLGGDAALSDVTKTKAGQYITEQLMPRGLSTKTVKDIVGHLSAFWSWAMHRGLCEGNPFAGLTRTIKDTSRGTKEKTAKKRRAWTNAEIHRLLQTLAERRGKDSALWAMTVLGLFTGMRVNEIAETELDDVHGTHIHIPEGKTESSIRDVPLHPLIRPLVKQLKKTSTDGYLVSGLKRGGDDDKRAHEFVKRFSYFIRKVAGITDERLVFHSLRKSFATALERAGVPESTAQQIVGHAKQSLTYGLYSQGVDLKGLQEAVGRVTYGAAVDGLVRD